MDDEGATHSPVWGVSDIASGHHLSYYRQRDGFRPAQHSIKSELTESPDFRILKSSPVLPRQPSSQTFPTQAAIPASYNTRNISCSQDVRELVNSSASYLSLPVTRTDAYSHILGPSVSSSSTPLSQHVLIHRRQRPRTSNQVFTAPHGTIAPHGLPQSLPPAPSTQPRRTQPESELPDFTALSQNYLNMLRQKPTDTTTDADNMTVAATNEASDFGPEVMQSILDVINGEYLIFDDDDDGHRSDTSSASSTSMPPPTPQTPDLWTSPAWSDANDFGSRSPDADFVDDLLNTPLFGDDDSGMLTGMFNEHDFEGGALFPPMEEYPYEKPAQPVAPTLPDDLYTFTPESPSLHDFASSINPTSLFPSPRSNNLSSFQSPAAPAPVQSFTTSAAATEAPVIAKQDVFVPRGQRRQATGTRKGVTPAALVPIDAPTQARKYVLPSATSKKDVPLGFAKKRSRSTAFGEEEEEFNEAPPGPNASEREQIEYKRRQNTVAARRSRKRKLEYQQNLEDKVERLTRERDIWKTRATMCQEMLIQSGLNLPPFSESIED
ncbi:hypothetical protein H0H87_001118 [Tephrocybe sp. NHM501043]|nr:hypothetical protein H0H87_001118 [Tephrocybe sp. NHM501043]